MIRLTLPLPPSTNHLYSTNRQGRRFLSKEGQAFKLEVKQRVVLYMSSYAGPPIGKDDALIVTVELSLLKSSIYNKGWPEQAKTRYKKMDLDNRCKALLDATFEGLGLDDSQVFQLSMFKKESSLEEGCSIVEVRCF